MSILDSYRSDFALAFRRLRQSPLFSTAVILALATAIAAVSSAFAIVRGVLLKPLPMIDQRSLVVLRQEHPSHKDVVIGFSIQNLRDYAATTRVLTAVAGVQYDAPAAEYLRNGRGVFPVGLTLVSGNLFEVLGARAELGRVLEPRDDVVGGARVAVISHSLWTREFGADTNIIGRTVRFSTSDTAITIVGIMPRGFDFPVGTTAWLPSLPVLPQFATNNGGLYGLVGRLRSGQSIDRARAELRAFVARYPPSPGLSARLLSQVLSIDSLVMGDVRPTLILVAGAVALVLLIAVANVANLFLVRGWQQRRELAVRSALGSSRTRLVQQLLIEGVLFAMIAAALGILIGGLLLRVVIAVAPAGLPRIDDIALDRVVIVVSATLGLAAALLFSLVPAVLATSKTDLISSLRANSRALSPSGGENVGARLAVVAENAFAVMVLVAAVLLGRTLYQLQTVPFGYGIHQLVEADVEFPASLQSATEQAAFYNRVIERLEALPDVASATAVLDPPYAGSRGWDTFYAAEGQSAAEAAANPSPDLQVVLPEYFATLGIRILGGRAIDATDRKGSTPVVVVSDALARQTWPGQNPIGKRIDCGGLQPHCIVVVGVAEDVRYRDLESPRPVIYRPWAQAPELQLPVIVARGRSGGSLAPSEIRIVVQEVDQRVVVTKVSRLDDALSTALARPKFNLLIVGAFAGIAMLLAAFGAYAMLAAIVRQRLPELGIRLALGATPGEIRRLVIVRGLGLAVVGLVSGILVSLGLSRLLASLLYGVCAVDPLTFMASFTTMFGIATLACWRPATMASRVDPLQVLRME